MIEEKLVTKSFLKEFADKCKKIFRPKHADVTTGVSYAIIDTDLPWEGKYSCEIKLTGTAAKSILNATVAASLVQASGVVTASGAVNDLGDASIQSGYIGRTDDGNFRIVVEVSNISALNADVIFFIEGKSYNVASSITFTDEWEYPEYNTNIVFKRNSDLEDLESNEIPIKTATVVAGGVEFTIVDATGLDKNFPEDTTFNSVYQAGQLANNKQLVISGAVTGSTVTNFNTEKVEIATTLNTDNKDLTEKIQNMINSQSGQQSIATETSAGVIKLGNTSKTITGYMPVRYTDTYGAYVVFNAETGLPYLQQLSVLPSVVGEQKEGTIVQYVGETTDTLTNGFIYKASVGGEEEVKKHTYVVNFIGDKNASVTAAETTYTADTTPLKKVNTFFETKNQTRTFIKQDDGSWEDSDGNILTADEFKAAFKDFSSNLDSYISLNSTAVITLTELTTESTSLLKWAQYNVQPEAAPLTAGNNIAIDDNKISALGYTYDADLNSFTTLGDTPKSNAVSIGSSNTLGESTTIVGSKNDISNNVNPQNSIILGYGNKITSDRGIRSESNVIIGINNVSDCFQSTLIGIANHSVTEGNILLGRGLIDSEDIADDFQTIIGKYNAQSSEPFIVGGGGSHQFRKNLLTISSAGLGTFSSDVVATKSDGTTVSLIDVARGSVYSAGQNIGITDNTISALGYTYDAAKETFTVKTPIVTNNEAFTVSEGTATITITPESNRYNFIEATENPVITVTTGDFKGACEIELHIVNNGTTEITPSFVANGVTLKQMGLIEAIPAGKCEEVVLTYWKADYVSYNGGLEISE